LRALKICLLIYSSKGRIILNVCVTPSNGDTQCRVVDPFSDGIGGTVDQDFVFDTDENPVLGKFQVFVACVYHSPYEQSCAAVINKSHNLIPCNNQRLEIENVTYGLATAGLVVIPICLGLSNTNATFHYLLYILLSTISLNNRYSRLPV
jgi:hypothetical protein